jgi:hypothetical protein
MFDWLTKEGIDDDWGTLRENIEGVQNRTLIPLFYTPQMPNDMLHYLKLCVPVTGAYEGKNTFHYAFLKNSPTAILESNKLTSYNKHLKQVPKQACKVQKQATTIFMP